MNPESTIVIMDPPRRGLDKAALKALIAYRPMDIIYISCAADTMARDIRQLVDAGYQHCTSQLFDMFPRTVYFETVTHLSRKK
jgi:23S rRNA (uracil1939-C5)-methyltransferase